MQLLADSADALSPLSSAVEFGMPLSAAELSWKEMYAKYFPFVTTFPYAQRQMRLAEWFDSIERGVRPLTRVEIWPRGGGKSSSTELGIARVCAKLSRRYVMYVCETQEQAEEHVSAATGLIEQLGAGRKLNPYGAAKSWKRSRIQTDNGFNMVAFGLDVAARGTKIENYRPDLIIFDDIDNEGDTEVAIKKKIARITKSILPAGSGDVAILFIQNMIHKDGIIARLHDGRADFCQDRVVNMEPAIFDLQYGRELSDNGVYRAVIKGGTPSWEGQSLATCQAQMREWSIESFLAEAQHEVEEKNGTFFCTANLRYISLSELPAFEILVRVWDRAATENGGDHTVGVLMGMTKSGLCVILDMIRGQFGSEKVKQHMIECAKSDPPGTIIGYYQDPSQAGKDQKEQMDRVLKPFAKTFSVPASRNTNKAVNARGQQECLNLGNMLLVKAVWNLAFRAEYSNFKETMDHESDDIVDAVSLGYNYCYKKSGSSRKWSMLSDDPD